MSVLTETHRAAHYALKEFNGAVRNRHWMTGINAPDGTEIYMEIIHIEGKLHKLIGDLKALMPKDTPIEKSPCEEMNHGLCGKCAK